MTSASSSTAPVIGLTTYRQRAQTGVWDVEAAFLPAVYFDAITRAGGIPVLLPPQELGPDGADRILDRLDGLVITGGGDVDPARYGADAHERTDRPNELRDAFEDALLGAAIAREVPFLGICRGLQLLNVHRGGSLVQHLPDVVGDDRYNKGGGVFATNDVSVAPGSALAALVATDKVAPDDAAPGDASLAVKSYHHQAIDAVGDGIAVTARSADGTIQAVELTDVPFGVAVQWHPEEDAAEDVRLFDGLVRAAQAAAATRAATPIAVEMTA